MSELTVSIPEASHAQAFAGLDVETVVWDMKGPCPRDRVDMAILPLRAPTRLAGLTKGLGARLVQHTSIGYDGLEDVVYDGLVFANSAGVYEEPTAENALTSILAAQRGLPAVLDNQRKGIWHRFPTPGLLDKQVLLVGVGGVGGALARRLEACGADVVRVGSRQREDVHGPEDLPQLLPEADVVVVIVPLTESTRKMVDADFLGAMKDGALLANFARGEVADTQAILAEAGRLRFALDVTDPEPLPEGHPLFFMPDTIITPHGSGWTDAELPRLHALWRRQAEHLLAGEEPENIVWRS